MKRIVVKQDGRLSLQKHHYRVEHWVVVRGTADVTVNDTVRVVDENDATNLPIDCTHQLMSPGKIALELIELQSRGYLGLRTGRHLRRQGGWVAHRAA